MPRPDLFGAKKALVLGEFGGLGLPLGPYLAAKKTGAIRVLKTDELFKRYKTLTDKLEELKKQGLSAAVYTQTTDVEGEVNGFMTYDRKVMKMPLKELHQLNSKLY